VKKSAFSRGRVQETGREYSECVRGRKGSAKGKGGRNCGWGARKANKIAGSRFPRNMRPRGKKRQEALKKKKKNYRGDR